MSLIQRYFEKVPETSRSLAATAYLAALDHIKATAPHVSQAIIQELIDQRSHIKLIASENYSSLAVQLAMGNLLTDKYAEGYAGHRFYAGCENVDTVEQLAQTLLIDLFGCEHAYVQPHSGADANMIAYWSILVHKVQTPEVEKLGKKNVNQLSDEEYESIRQMMLNLKVMGLSLDCGGHLTHGFRANLSSKMMRAVSYKVDPKTEQIDYAALQEQVLKEQPDILIAGFSAHPRKLNFAKFREIADSVKEKKVVLLVDMAHFAGLVAGKAFQGEYDPIPYADIVTSTTHKTLRGPRGGMILCKKEYADVINKGCPLVLGGPLPHVMAAKAVAFQEALQPSFNLYASNIIENAQHIAEQLQKRGLRLVTGWTENHMALIDLTASGISGRQAEVALRQAGITVNRNAIPFDTKSPWETSGLRIGTPAITTLGMGADQMVEIADIIADVIFSLEPGKEASSAVVEKAKERVASLLQIFPLYPEIVL